MAVMPDVIPEWTDLPNCTKAPSKAGCVPLIVLVLHLFSETGEPTQMRVSDWLGRGPLNDWSAVSFSISHRLTQSRLWVERFSYSQLRQPRVQFQPREPLASTHQDCCGKNNVGNTPVFTLADPLKRS